MNSVNRNNIVFKYLLLFAYFVVPLMTSHSALAVMAEYNILGFVVPSSNVGGNLVETDPDNGFDLAIGQAIEFNFITDASLAADIDYAAAGLPPALIGLQAISLSDTASSLNISLGSRMATAADDICFQFNWAQHWSPPSLALHARTGL